MENARKLNEAIDAIDRELFTFNAAVYDVIDDPERAEDVNEWLQFLQNTINTIKYYAKPELDRQHEAHLAMLDEMEN